MLEIIKDQENKELIYVVIREDYDGENERTIIATGKNELEAMKKAAEKIYETVKNCQSIMRHIGESLSHGKDIDFDSQYLVNSEEIFDPIDLGSYSIDTYDALRYDEETKNWNRLYR